MSVYTENAEVANVPYSILGNVVTENNGVVDGRTLFTAMKRGCKVAKSIFEDYIELLGVGVMNVIEVLRPDIIISVAESQKKVIH